MNITSVRRMLILPLLIFTTFVGVASGQKATGKESAEAAQEEVLEADDQFNEAVMAKDQDALERILADGLSWIARGDRLNKDQMIADVLSENLHFKSLTHDSILVNTFGNTAVVTGHSTSILEYKGKLFNSPRLFTTVYVKMDGRWRMVAHHVSELVKP
jgi:hypothetical protein